ncbi:cysteine-rich receptor-like protein kinase 29 [Quercus suber]|uniref:Cysteine-rich receptor-like protein kinase 29 n=1 Tax=Quercus suber TaxID=58331 RepID=A0AAW0IZQ1_QUESU
MQKYRVTIIMSTSRLSLFFFYAILIILVNPTINAQRDPYVLHECSTTGNVTSNSTLRENLNTLISTLSSNTQIDYGFYNFTAGEGTNKVYATGLCRADLSPTDCRSCVNMSAHELLQLCPTQKEGVMWYMNCTARYSNNSIFGVMETKPTRALTSGNVSNLTEFNAVLEPLFYDLRVRASAGGIFRKIAVGTAYYKSDNFTIYGLMQCSPDLSEMDCSNCLVVAQNYIQGCCSGNSGLRILAPSCNLRIETDQFYDSTLVQSPPSLSPPPSKGKRSNSSKTIIAIVVVVVILVVIIICICISLRAWTNWRNMTASNIIDPTLGVGSTTEIIRCIHIGLLCVQENAADRPTMASVVLMLNSNSISLSVPSRPAFFIHSNVEPDSQSDQSILLASTNDASITVLHPR